MQEIKKSIKRNILLNPGPATTTAFVKDALVVSDICPREKEFGDLMGEIRRDLVSIVGGTGKYEAVLMTASGTGGVEAALTSLIPEGKKVLILDNGAYGKRMGEICEAYKIPHTTLRFPWGRPVDLNQIEKTITSDGDFSHLAFIHHETTVGLLNDARAIGTLAKKHGLSTILDAMSSFAGLPINVIDDKIDFLISSSNKCIQGMAGLTFVIAHKEELLKSKDLPKRNFYFNLYHNFKSQEFDNQSLFTPAVQVAYALKAAIFEFKKEGAENRFKRYQENYETLKSGVRELGLEFLVEEKYHAKLLTAIVEPAHSNYSFDKMHDYLYAKNITIYPGKGGNKNAFRIAVIGEITSNDIKLFLSELKNYLNTL